MLSGVPRGRLASASGCLEIKTTQFCSSQESGTQDCTLWIKLKLEEKFEAVNAFQPRGEDNHEVHNMAGMQQVYPPFMAVSPCSRRQKVRTLMANPPSSV